MRKLLSSFPHYPPERVVVMLCQWRAPHGHRERLTSVCSSRRRLSFLLLLLLFFFFTKDNISLKVIFKREVKMNMCHVNSGGFPYWQGQLPQTLILNVDTSCLQRCGKCPIYPSSFGPLTSRVLAALENRRKQTWVPEQTKCFLHKQPWWYLLWPQKSGNY